MRVYGSLSLTISILVISMAVGLKYLLSWHLTSFLVVVLATTLAYIPHELIHIAVARRLGCLSTYTLDPVGLVLTLVSSALPVKIIMPGYVIISAPYYDSFTRKKIEAITASAGPLTNIAIGINGSVGRIEEHLDEVSSKAKYVYIELPESIKAYGSSGELLKNSIIGSFSLSTIERPYGCFLTITTGRVHAYDYVIINPNIITIVMSSKRTVYIEHSNNLVTIYIA